MSTLGAGTIGVGGRNSKAGGMNSAASWLRMNLLNFATGVAPAAFGVGRRPGSRCPIWGGTRYFMPVRKLVLSLLPASVLKAYRSFQLRREARKYRALTTREIFTKVYSEKLWGTSQDDAQKFYSGNGSHEDGIVAAYVGAVKGFLSLLDRKPNVVDLGCGDFHVGANVRPLCDRYIACDVVPDLIEFNKERYKALNVDFRVLDLAEDDLPKADVVFIRQVLQHLSNEHIKSALPKICSSYAHLVLTEHIPRTETFVPNIDKPAGPGVRVALDSGLVLTKPPFNLKVKSERVLCEIPEHGPYGGHIRTTLYQLS